MKDCDDEIKQGRQSHGDFIYITSSKNSADTGLACNNVSDMEDIFVRFLPMVEKQNGNCYTLRRDRGKFLSGISF